MAFPLVKFTHYVPCTARPDLLEVALASIRAIWPVVVVIDNTPGGWLRVTAPVRVIRAPVSVTCAQTMNMLHRFARDAGHAAFGYQHHDARIADDGGAEKYLSFVQTLLDAPKSKWGAVLCSYDLVSAYNVEAINHVGPWDVDFPNANYKFDVDWFHRVRKTKYEILHCPIGVEHLDGGSTTKFMPGRVGSNFNTRFNGVYYSSKWGGETGYERFDVPFNGLT